MKFHDHCHYGYFYRIMVLAAMAIAAITPLPAEDLTRFVDLFIGTGGHGHTHPAAMVPHGMIQPGPDTRWQGWDACSGYHYSDQTVNGFSCTRLSGTGCADFGDFLLMPTTGNQQTVGAPVGTVGDSVQMMPWASAFSHKEETATPGYYAVRLLRYGIFAEMTATERAAAYRFTYPEGKGDAGLILDLNYSIQEQVTLDADVKILDAYTICAHRRSYWWAYDQELYFYTRFSQPFTYTIQRDTLTDGRRVQPRCRLLLKFPTATGRQLTVRAAISAVDPDGAKRNLEAEMPTDNFEAVREEAHRKWADELARIDVVPAADGNGDERTIFYTAMYHAAVAPMIFSDVDGRYRGMDLKVHQAAETNYTVFSLWDTFRALHPLISVLAPHQNEAYIRCLMRKGEEGGCIPKWDCASNYTACMLGYHFASLVADAHAKGYRDFDAEKALDACVKLATGDTSGIAPVVPGYKLRDLLPEARRQKTGVGYIFCDQEGESVAKALEYAYDDWCISRLADALGDTRTADAYSRQAQAYRRYFDTSTRFMRGIDSNHKWRMPFDPQRSEHRADDYCEGNAWQWTWFVPHDIPGLISLMGGRQAFIEKLDSLFTMPSHITGDLVSSDISGLIGQYAHGNEPGHHIPYLYNYAGRPERTQEVVDSILYSLYAAAPDGLAGNEDCGQMSTWYILSSIGLYQVCPGRPEWTIGRPLFSEATIHLPNGKTFTVRAIGNSRRAKYIRRMTLDGHPLEQPFISHQNIMRGGILELHMDTRPRCI